MIEDRTDHAHESFNPDYSEVPENYLEEYDEDHDVHQNDDVPSYFHHAKVTAPKPSAKLATVNATPTFAWFTPADDNFTCRLCKERFTSRNMLYKHLEVSNHFEPSVVVNHIPNHTLNDMDVPDTSGQQFIKSKAKLTNVGTGYAFRDYNYCEIRFLTRPNGSPEWGCLDTGSGMSMVDVSIVETLPSLQRIFSDAPIFI